MPIYEFGCDECKCVWEDLFNVSDPMPTLCPECGSEEIKKLISWCSGSVLKTGAELTQHLRQEGEKIRRQSRTNEDLKANLVGESKYHEIKSANDKLKQEYKHKG